MKQIQALFYKEYRETRIFTCFLLLLGLVVPIVGRYVFGASSANFVPIAILLNLVLLGATAFARESENRTLTTLKRIVPDWRLAAFCKFGYAFLATLVLFGLFYAISPLYTSLYQQEFFPVDGSRSETLLSSALFGLDAFCWGVFWTGRAKRSLSALGLAFACPAAVVAFLSFVLNVERLAQGRVDLIGYAIVFGPRLCVDLLALALAPIKTRFGYRELERTGSDVRISSIESWTDAAKLTKPAEFFTLYRHELGALSLFGTRARHTALEVVLLGLGAYIFTCFHQFGVEGGQIYGRCYLWLVFAVFATGALADSKEDRSALKERFHVTGLKYYLASFLAVATVGLALFAIGARIYLKQYYYENYFVVFMTQWQDFPRALESCVRRLCEPLVPLSKGMPRYPAAPFSVFVVTMSALLLPIAFWSASLRGGRLIGLARTAVLFCLSALAFVAFSDTNSYALNLLYVWIPVAVQLRYRVLLVLTVILLALCPGLASYRIATRKLAYRKSWIGAVLPLVLPVALFLTSAWIHTSAVYRNVPDRLEELDGFRVEVGLSTFDRSIPQDFNAYFAEQKELGANFKFFNGDAGLGIEPFLRANMATRDRQLVGAADLDYEQHVYERFHALVSTCHAGPKYSKYDMSAFDLSQTLEFLLSIPELRATPTDRAISLYAHLYPNGRKSEIPSDYSQVGQYLDLTKKPIAFKKELAVWNFCQAYPDLMKQVDELIDGKIERLELPTALVSNDTTYNVVVNDLWSLLVVKPLLNELNRRALVLYFSMLLYHEQKDAYPKSVQELYDAGYLDETFLTKNNPNATFLLATCPSQELDTTDMQEHNLDIERYRFAVKHDKGQEAFEYSIEVGNRNLQPVNGHYYRPTDDVPTVYRNDQLNGMKTARTKNAFYANYPTAILVCNKLFLPILHSSELCDAVNTAYGNIAP